MLAFAPSWQSGQNHWESLESGVVESSVCRRGRAAVAAAQNGAVAVDRDDPDWAVVCLTAVLEIELILGVVPTTKAADFRVSIVSTVEARSLARTEGVRALIGTHCC
jgi:hypothetical protein